MVCLILLPVILLSDVALATAYLSVFLLFVSWDGGTPFGLCEPLKLVYPVEHVAATICIFVCVSVCMCGTLFVTPSRRMIIFYDSARG